MYEFDISRYVFSDKVDGDGWDKSGTFDQMLKWVYKNIGKQTEKNGLTSFVMRKGHGWEIQTRKWRDIGERPSSFNMIGWYMCIEDEQKATLFALKWVN